MRHQRHEYTFYLTHIVLHILCHIVHNVFRNFDTGLKSFFQEHITAQFIVRARQFHRHAPFEPRQQTRLHSIQFRRRTIARQYQMSLFVVQMIEDMEECVLCSRFACKFLDIVHNKHINALIEIYKVIDLIVSYRCRILRLKRTGAEIKHTQIRILLLHAYTYRLNQMSLSNTCWTEYKHRVERLFFRMSNNRISYGKCQFIAFALAIILKCIYRIQL